MRSAALAMPCARFRERELLSAYAELGAAQASGQETYPLKQLTKYLSRGANRRIRVALSLWPPRGNAIQTSRRVTLLTTNPRSLRSVWPCCQLLRFR